MIVPFAKWEPVPSHSGPMTAHQGLVLHVQVGNGDCYGEFSDPANGASSTWWVSKTGVLVQYVDSDLAAWTQGAGNFTWNSVETEGVPAEPLTDAQIQTLARLYVWGHNTYGWPLVLTDDVNGHGFGWHGMGGAAWGGHTGCPGDLRKSQRSQILYLASLALNPPPPTHQGVKMIARCADGKNGYWIVKPDGSVYAYGCGYFGAVNPGASAGGAMKQPGEVAIGIESSTSGKGYAILSSAFNLFAFGDFQYLGHP